MSGPGRGRTDDGCGSCVRDRNARRADVGIPFGKNLGSLDSASVDEGHDVGPLDRTSVPRNPGFGRFWLGLWLAVVEVAKKLYVGLDRILLFCPALWLHTRGD